MRSNFVRIVATLLFGLSATHAVALDIPKCPSATNCDNDPAHLEAFVKSFYTWYVVSTFENDGAIPEKKIQEKLRATLTPHLFADIENKAHNPDWDIEPIICSQDYFTTWFYPSVRTTHLQNASTAEMEVSFPIPIPPRYIREMRDYKPEPQMHVLNVTLKVTNERWLIDKFGGKPCEPYKGR